MTDSEKCRTTFWETIQRPEIAEPLRKATLEERLGDWTKALTDVAVATCEAMGWQAAAKGHKLELLPETGQEYLGLDVTAFASSDTRWRFPTAVMELENSKKDDRIAYSLWKVLCVHAALRIVFCYRRSPEQGSGLIRFLREEVVHAMGLTGLTKLRGETVVVIGSRDESATFPYGFFKWWKLDTNTGSFRTM